MSAVTRGKIGCVLFASSLGFFAPFSNGEIVYRDVADFPLFRSQDHVDLNGDSTIDIWWTTSHCVPGPILTGGTVAGGGLVRGDCCDACGGRFARGLAPGSIIDGSKIAGGGTLAQPGDCGGDWCDPGTILYMGVSFRIAGETHYAWMRIENRSVDRASPDLYLLDYAYEAIAGKPILAGETREVVYVSACGSDSNWGVTSDCTSGNRNGPKRTIQSGMDSAASYGEIIVGPGTYFENLHIGHRVSVRSSAGAAATIIDGRGAAAVVTMREIGGEAALDGFTITHGRSVDGGGMYLRNSALTISNCRFVGNTADHTGGAIYAYNGDPTFVNCVLQSNSAQQGGAIWSSRSTPVLVNCSVTGNFATLAGGIYGTDSDERLMNCILWGDAAGEIVRSGGQPSVNFCDIQGGFAGTGNIDSDPSFVDRAHGNLRLRAGSPCIDAGSNSAIPGISTDLARAPRFHDDPGTPDSGAGTPPVVDMGAYEFQFSTRSCQGYEPCDADCDGSINQFDVQPFVDAITTHGGCSPCAGDVNGDGSTNQFDVQGFVACLGG